MSEFFSIYNQGLARVAACSFPVVQAQPQENASAIISLARQCDTEGVCLAAFSELSMTGTTLGDLFTQDVLIRDTLLALERVREASEGMQTVLIVGAPIPYDEHLYNCAVIIHKGHVLGIVPKTTPTPGAPFASGIGIASDNVTLPHLQPLVDQFLDKWQEDWKERMAEEGDYEEAAFTTEMWQYDIPPNSIPFGTDVLFSANDKSLLTFGVEIGSDADAPLPASTRCALAGAHIIVNLAAEAAGTGIDEARERDIASLSQRLACAYIYSGAGEGESSTDYVASGQRLIAENGTLLVSASGAESTHVLTADIDLDILSAERRQRDIAASGQLLQLRSASVFSGDSSRDAGVERDFRRIYFRLGDMESAGESLRELRRPLDRFPLVVRGGEDVERNCEQACEIQVRALVQRLRSIGKPKIVLGVSGGLDSTQALLVAARACDRLGLPRTHILAYTMPGFATSAGTKSNATDLAQAIGCSFEELDIRPAAQQMLADMKHPFASGEKVYDIAFENVQAGLRADYLFRLANQHGGIVLGTGDLSEGALGWCTYGVGDHISHYNVNPGLSKTFLQHIVRWTVKAGLFDDDVSRVLQAILDTEISPELIPSEDGEAIQSTQSTIGPYELHDFTLYHTVRYGMLPSRIAFRAWHAWKDAGAGVWTDLVPEAERRSYSLAEIKKWEGEFFRRFFSSQFKRSTSVDGPGVVPGVSLSPRGFWAMPSDASARIWQDDVSTIPDSPVIARNEQSE
ncbi:MAG: NAD(+) synthase [Actinomycetaceae bacterium]|nr:NAD(+) synthase [Actinomycetaceae bacterium]